MKQQHSLPFHGSSLDIFVPAAAVVAVDVVAVVAAVAAAVDVVVVAAVA